MPARGVSATTTTKTVERGGGVCMERHRILIEDVTTAIPGCGGLGCYYYPALSIILEAAQEAHLGTVIAPVIKPVAAYVHLRWGRHTNGRIILHFW